MFETDNLFEFFKNMPSSVCILMVIPLVMFTAPAACSHEFPVFRVQQFDLNGVKYGKISTFIQLTIQISKKYTAYMTCHFLLVPRQN